MKAMITPALVAAALALSACGGSEEATPVDNAATVTEDFNSAEVALPEESSTDLNATDLNVSEPALPAGNEVEGNLAEPTTNAL